MLVFASDGTLSQTEIAVMIAILIALCLSCGCCSDDVSDSCFCDKSL